MAVDYKKLKVGDKVRYLGGYIPEHYGGLTIGKEYDVIGIENRDLAYIANDKGYGRFIGYYNAHCFELVDDEQSETSCNCACKHAAHLVNLAKEVAELKRELSDLKEYVEEEAVLFDEGLAEVETTKHGEDKTQHMTVYASENIDKLFGGDSE